MPYATMQEAFDFTVGKLAAQKVRSIMNFFDNDTRMCSYGNKGGERCSIGHSLSFDAHDVVGNVVILCNNFAQAVIDLTITNCSWDLTLNFWRDLQRAHDESEKVCQLHSRLNAICVKFDLKPDVIQVITEWRFK